MNTEDKIFKYIKANQEHSTIVGKIITVDHAEDGDDDEKIMEFSMWMTDFLKKAENFAKKTKKQKK